MCLACDWQQVEARGSFHLKVGQITPLVHTKEKDEDFGLSACRCASLGLGADVTKDGGVSVLTAENLTMSSRAMNLFLSSSMHLGVETAKLRHRSTPRLQAYWLRKSQRLCAQRSMLLRRVLSLRNSRCEATLPSSYSAMGKLHNMETAGPPTQSSPG